MPAVLHLAAIAAALQLAGGTGSDLEVRLARSYGPAESTLVRAFLRSGYPAVQPAEAGRDAVAAYRVVLTARLRHGQVRASRTLIWRASHEGMAEARRYAVVALEFTLAPGQYVCEATVVDSATGQERHVTAQVVAFARQPLLSDLILATALRTGGAAPAQTDHDVAIGSAVLRDAGWPSIGASTESLVYFAEVYEPPGGGDSIVFSSWLEDSDGQRRRLDPPPRLGGQPGSRFVTGRLPIEALTGGRQRLVVIAQGGSDAAERTVDLPVRHAPASQSPPSPDRFAEATEAQLDSLYAPLVYIMQQDERGIYSSLPTAGRREFLRAFWARRDPTPGTIANEAASEFYERVTIANRDFREAGAGGVAGWRTDRGRVVIMHGVPDETLRQPQPAETLPYEAWKYTRGRPVKFVFVDLTRFGNYVLVWSNDVREGGRPNWRQLLGPRAVAEVLRF